MADTTPPVLTSLSIPTTVNLTNGKAAFTVSATASDLGSGVKQVAVWLDAPLSYDISMSYSSGSSSKLFLFSGFSDSWADGKATNTYGILSTNPDKTYNISTVDVTDNQGNTATYNTLQLKAMGVNTAFTLTGGTADTTPPVLTSLSIPTTVNLTNGKAAFTVSATASDLGSGVKQVAVWLDAPLSYDISMSYSSGSSSKLFLFSGFSDSWADGKATNTYGILSTNPDKTYNISTVDVTDNQGNTVTYNTSQLKAMGVNTAFTLTSGTVDTTGLVGGLANVAGTSANDTFNSGTGSHAIDGGAGRDTVSYSGTRASFSLNKTSTGFSLSATQGGTTDTLQNIERLKFTDGSGIALDTGATQAGGQTQLLLGAVLGKDLVATKKPLIGAVIDLFDQGFTMQQLASALMRLDIWGTLANGGNGSASNTQIANYLLTKVNGVAPDASTLASATLALAFESGTASQGNFLWHLAESAANQTQVGLVGLASTGLEFSV